jgi:hypothetical protein
MNEFMSLFKFSRSQNASTNQVRERIWKVWSRPLFWICPNIVDQKIEEINRYQSNDMKFEKKDRELRFLSEF